MDALLTLWGREVLEEAKEKGEAYVPLPEYPRPSLVREGFWECLNGTWEAAFEKDPGVGRELFPRAFPLKILVPFSPEAPLSGVGRQLLPGEVLHYTRRWELKKKKTGRYLLHFGAVDQSCRVYVNGAYVGGHLGGYLPFTLDVTEHLMEGENDFWVVVRDESDTGYHSRGKQKLQKGGMWYTAQSGIWQSVWIERVPHAFIKRVITRPLPDLSGISLYLEAEKPGDLRAEAVISFQGEVMEKLSLKPGEWTSCQMREPRLWSPDSPSLYDLSLTLGEDRCSSYFGIRSLERRKDKKGIWRLYLNGNPIFLTGLLDQGYYPGGLYTAPKEEAFIYDILAMKDMGFNLLRKHIKIEPERFYYACDRLGMILWQDMVNGGTSYHDNFVTILPTIFTLMQRTVPDSQKSFGWLSRVEEKSRREYEKELKETVELLQGHPSLVAWVPFNEGWGQFEAKEATKSIRALDPTRLVDEASGWFDQGGGDFYSIHNYFRRLHVRPKKDRVVALTECGGYSCLMEGHALVKKIYGYRKYDTPEELTQAMIRLWEKHLFPNLSKGLCVSIFTQVSDIEDEVNGLLTYDREILKVDVKVMRQLNERLLELYEKAVRGEKVR